MVWAINGVHFCAATSSFTAFYDLSKIHVMVLPQRGWERLMTARVDRLWPRGVRKSDAQIDR